MPKEVIIIANTETGKLEAWGSLTKACQSHTEFQYPTIKKLKYPFIHKGYEFKKLEYNPKK